MGRKKRQVIGIDYFLGFHMVLCHYSEDMSINKIAAGERLAWTGPVTSSSTIYINSPSLFGGTTKEGGVQGSVDVMMGESTQTINSYLSGQISSSIPSFRGVVSFVANQIYCCANNPYIKNWWTQITSIPGISWYSGTSNIDSGSANAAHIIRDCLTNEDWGMGIDEAYLDDDSFVAFADTLYDESFGLSLLLVNQGQIDKFIQEVLKHVQGVIYTDRSTGKYIIKLVRGDYTIDDLLTFDESNIISVDSYDKPLPSELLNEVIVKYRPRGDTKDAAAAFQNLASVESQGGIVSKTVEYPGIDTHANAAVIAARELRQQSAQLSKVKLKVNRDAYDLNIGDVFVFTWEDYGISELVMRIVSINFGKIDSPEIIIDAIQDVFSLSDATYLSPSDTEWTDPLEDPVALVDTRMEEMTWWDIVNTFDAANVDYIENEITASFYIYLGIENVSSPGFELWERVGTDLDPEYTTDGEYIPEAFLDNDISYTDTTGISVNSLNSIDVTTITLGQYGIIDDEYIRIDDIDEDANTIDIGRGCLDTVPAEHSADTRIWFAEENGARSETEYASGITVRAQALVETGLGVLELDELNETTILMDARQNKPYPPGQFEINSEAYPTYIDAVTLVTVTWAHRDRLSQTVTVIDQLEDSIGPEDGTTYELDFYDEDDVLQHSVTALSVETYTWSTEEADSGLSGRLNTSVRIVLKTVRDTVYSWQEYDYTVVRAGYGYNYGYFYGGDA